MDEFFNFLGKSETEEEFRKSLSKTNLFINLIICGILIFAIVFGILNQKIILEFSQERKFHEYSLYGLLTSIFFFLISFLNKIISYFKSGKNVNSQYKAYYNFRFLGIAVLGISFVILSFQDLIEGIISRKPF